MPTKNKKNLTKRTAIKTHTDVWYERSWFQKLFGWSGLAVLLGTTTFWSILGARTHQYNADQVVNTLLAENHQTFQHAFLPTAHTFMIKWPLYFLNHLLGGRPIHYVILTVLCSLVTVGVLALILYRFEKRPMVVGVIYLALASMLLFIPAQPYAGGLLPVNMAMLATRNIEYALYIILLAGVARLHQVKSWLMVLLVFGFGLLIVSDRLFLYLSLGGSLLMVVIYASLRNWRLVNVAIRWLIATLLATGLSAVVVWGLGAVHFAHFTSAAATGSPYGIVTTAKSLALGSFYGVAGIATNLGVNPAFNAPTLRSIPSTAWRQLLSWNGPGFVVNAAIVAWGIAAGYWVVRQTIKRRRNMTTAHNSLNIQLTLMLVASTVAAIVAFVITDHYYVADARYVAIAFFAFAVCIAAYTSSGRSWKTKYLLYTSLFILVGIASGIHFAWTNHNKEVAALSTIESRDKKISDILDNREVGTLVGDYWRVVPIKAADPSVNVTPLADCTQLRNTLSSGNWQPDLRTTPFAYLLTYDQKLTDYPTCSLDQVLAVYGRPNSSTVIEGTLSNPKEQLLFYDHGINNSAPAGISSPTSTIRPIDPSELPYTNCAGPTVMNIVAHEDDDLLFMSPDLLTDLHEPNRCVRTVYVTAGDAGQGQFYWLNRQRAAQAAYSQMINSDAVWVERNVKLSDNSFVTVSNLRGNARVSLIFFHLPDGSLKGNGFRSTHNESLTKLLANHGMSIRSVADESVYTKVQLESALARLMSIYQPTAIHSQSSQSHGQYQDHPDHNAVGKLARTAVTEYEKQKFENAVQIPVSYYLGYSSRSLPQNVFGGQLQQKEAAFFAYTKLDNVGCNSKETCDKTPTYGAYLKRQYKVEN